MSHRISVWIGEHRIMTWLVSMAATMVISTMQEKSCILQNARQFLKCFKIQSSTSLTITWWYCEIIVQFSFHNYSANYFLHNWLEFVFEISILLKIINEWFTKLTFKNISHSHIFAFIFCVNLVTSESLWCHNSVVMHVIHTKTCSHFLQCTVCNRLIRIFVCQIQLHNVSKSMNLCHTRIEARCYHAL